MCKEVCGYVYMVRNKVNSKLYFGITENDFDTRYRNDIAKYTHNDHLKSSIEKYGIENFEINPQFDVAYTEDDLWDLEDMYICLYNTLDKKYGYNKRRSGSERKGHGKFSNETKHRLSELAKQKYDNGYINPLKGKNLSDGTKSKISDAHKTLYDNGYANPFEGKSHSDETRKKISESRKGKCVGEDNPMYGKQRTHSDETKNKMSKSHKGKYIGDNHPMAKTIICLETLQIFTTIKDASEWCSGDVYRNLKGKSKSAGKHPITKEKLHWMYYSDYLTQQNN
jgi:group I intron endonuclease